MMENFYSVRCVRVTTPWFGTKKFYLPMVYDTFAGRHYCIKNDDEIPTVWGYETEDDAWKEIDLQIWKDQAADEEAYQSSDYRHNDSDREDFHADG